MDVVTEQMGAKRKIYLSFILILVGVGGILFGFDLGVISGALLFIRESIPLTTAETELIVSAVFAGGLIGTLIAGPVADKFGRKPVVALSAIVFIVGILCIILSHGFALLLIGRILIGVGVGLVSVSVPLYALELAPTKIRGLAVNVFQFMLTFGLVLAYFIDYLFTASHDWRGMFAVVLIPSVVLLVGVLVLPESPRYLLSIGKEKEARKVLQDTRQPSHVEPDIQAIRESFAHSEGTWRELFSRRLALPLMISGSIALLQQLTAVNSFLQYAPLMLKNAGLGSNAVAILGTLGIGVVNMIVTFVCMFMVDRIGRKPLLYTGLWGIIVCEIFSAIVQWMHLSPQLDGILSLAGLIGFIFFFAMGPCVVILLALSELFPTRVRGKGLAVCLFLNSLGSTVVASVFLTLIDTIGMGGVYLMSAIVAFCYFLIAKFGLPETKAKTLEEIQESMQIFH